MSLLSSIRLALILLVAASSAAYAQRGPAQVIVAPVTSGEFVDRVEALGTLRANESVDVTATVSDTITGIYFDDGARVEQGDTLVVMASEEERALVEEARASANEARRQLRRAEQLTSQGTVSESVLDQRRREFETAIARRNAIQSRLQDRIVTAPFDGVVGLRQLSIGALVSPGENITTLIDDSIMKLDFPVPETFLADVAVGQSIEATAAAFRDRAFTGEVVSIDNRVDPVTRSFIVRAEIANDEKTLLPGLLMTVTLLKPARPALIVAEEALVPLGRDQFVFVVDPSAEQPTAERRQVEVGSRRRAEVEILNGLDEGEFVVTRGLEFLRPGAPVTIRAIDNNNAPLGTLLEQNPSRG